MHNKVKISVVIAVYNAEAFIGETLESVLTQDFSDFELIVVDDGSTDKTPDIVDAAAAEYKALPDCGPRSIKVLHKRNGGVAEARNFGMKYASGEWMQFFDGDDIMHHDFLLKLAEHTVDGVDMVAGNCDKVTKYGYLIKRMEQEYDGHYETMNNRENLIKMADVSAIIGVKLIRKSLMDEHNIRFIDVLAEDVAMFLEVLYFCRGVYIENEAIMDYRIMTGSMSKNVTAKELTVLSLFEEVEQFLEPYDTNKEFPYAFYNMKVKVCRIYGLHFTGTDDWRLRKELFMRFSDAMLQVMEEHGEVLCPERLQDVERIEKKRKLRFLYLSHPYLLYHRWKWRGNQEVL